MHITDLKTKSGQNLSLKKISVLVGPNNAGKSQTLRDIKDRLVHGADSKPTILDKISFSLPKNVEEIVSGLEILPSKTITNKLVRGMKDNLLESDNFEIPATWLENGFEATKSYEFTLGNISKFRVAHLDSSTRLNLVRMVNSFNPHENHPNNLLQSLLLEKKSEAFLRRAFRNAFGMDIKLDWSTFVNLNLLVAKKLPHIPDNPQDAYPITKSINKIDAEGDGYKSFVGIILAILLSKGRIILLDEPEAFLHPAQARFLGKWIADHFDEIDGQLIVATHSANFLSGILSSEKEIDVFRLNRNNDETHFHLIPSHATRNLTKSSLLSSQRVLEAIFHKAVVVCEADADRAIYQGVAVIAFNNQEVLFIHSHNKQTLKDVAKLLLDAMIPVSVIADIDLLNDETDFVALFELLSGKKISTRCRRLRRYIAFLVNKTDDKTILDRIKISCSDFTKQLDKNEHSLDGAKGAYNRISKEFTRWSALKREGISAFDPQQQTVVKEIIEVAKSFRLFIVPVGELEGWIDVGVKRKNKWIVEALQAVYDKKIPLPLGNFVEEILAYP